MLKHKLTFLIILAVLLTSFVLPVSPVLGEDPPPPDDGLVYHGKVTQAEKEAAAERFKELYFSEEGPGGLPSAPGLAPAHIIGADGLPIPHYFGPYPNYALSPLPQVTYDPADNITATSVTGGIRKFINELAGLGEANASQELGQFIPVAVADNTTYPGSDYYEIALVEYKEQMHTDLPATTLRGYVQLDTAVIPGDGIALLATDGITPILKGDGSPAIGVTIPHYLGPTIITQKDVPVRIKFYNLLPTGEGGDLFIPVDQTVMGSGMGPAMDMVTGESVNYTQNRATLHLHGGRSPWISDGTPHQWTTPADEMTPYPKGVSVAYVPDMWFDANGNQVPAGTAGASNNPGDGSMTFFYTNQQSARFMFYHDHAYGITRLNVYAGEAAGYLIQDDVELDLIDRGIIPAEQIPLIIQDKTFVPDDVTPYSNIFGDYPSQMAFYDPTWDRTKWGDYGDLWYPHVYMPVQNPYDLSGVNAFGRWHYGPWFWPPVSPNKPPVDNPYYDPVNAPWEPPKIPGVPNNSMGMESFFDTPVVNGTVYPYLDVDPKSYRFRILNAANDRFWNLQLYIADNITVAIDGRANTEVRMVPADVSSMLPQGWPVDGREGGVPDPANRGPQMIQIASEGGFLPKPVILENQPIVWNLDPTTFNVGNVESGNLILGPAERADVIVDFSAFAGKTLILYNDAPAPFPALAPQYDYYTGAPDNSDTGGSPGTQPGWGPNTRTIMQIRVADIAPATSFNVTALNNEFTPIDHNGVFVRGQEEIIVGQTAYNEVYGTNFTLTGEHDGVANIQDGALSFQTLTGANVTAFDMEPKAIQDEMGEAFDVEYGRMSGFLGLEQPFTIAGGQRFVLYPYPSPPVEVIPIGEGLNGTQIWKITHNGVDTHPIHFHLYEVQVINRVGWDGAIRLPDANELGWKETVRVSPLEDTIVALRPAIPTLPFQIPNSIRLLDPTKPDGVALDTPPGGFMDPAANPVTITNHYVNFGWEYVWHCHILSHEEMDMMHAINIGVTPAAPSDLSITDIAGSSVNMSWQDNSAGETHWTIQRGESPTGPWTAITTIPSTTGAATGGVITFTDTSISTAGDFYYQVLATNIVGDTFDYATSAVDFPRTTMNSVASNWVNAGAITPSTIVVPLIGVTADVPLTLNQAGVVQDAVVLTGPVNAFTFEIPVGVTMLGTGGMPLNLFSAAAAANVPALPNNQVLVNALEFGPAGATFDPGITLSWAYNPDQLPAGVSPQNLTIAWWNGTAWVQLAGTVDTVNNKVTATVTHFTTFALMGTAANVNLASGWNTLSVPVKLSTGTDTWGELATAYNLNFSSAYQWNGTAFVWVDATKPMQPLDAIYVKMNASGSVSFVPFDGISAAYTKDLVAGWNFVGSGFIDPTKPVTEALTTAYFGPNDTWGYSQVISPTGVNQTAWVFTRDGAVIPVMQIGKGYWVFMTNPAMLAGFTSTP